MSTFENRIQLTDVIQAAKKTQLKVVGGRWGDATSCGCPMLILAIAHSEPPCQIPELIAQGVTRLHQHLRAFAYEYGRTTYGFSYTDGFLAGFDGSKGYLHGDTIRYKEGHEDGVQLVTEIRQLSAEEKTQLVAVPDAFALIKG